MALGQLVDTYQGCRQAGTYDADRILTVPMIMRILTAILIVYMIFQSQAGASGAALYDAHCAVCHGENGKGGVGVPLSLPSFLAGADDDYFRKTIRLGRPGRVMPAFDQLSEDEVSAIIAHIRGWSEHEPVVFSSTWQAKGDVTHGGLLYQQYCAACHGKHGEGGSGTGVTFSRPRDLPIIAPALNNSGFQAAASDQMIRQTLMHGREGTPMGSFLEQGLSQQDIDDVIRYIRSFGGEQPEHKPGRSDDAVLVVESSSSFEDTVEALRQTIVGENFRLIREQSLDKGLVAEGHENSKQHIIYFCNFSFLNKVLAIDPRVGMFLPCRVTVVEHEGKVLLMTINPLRLSQLFNNAELDKYCKEMLQLYEGLLEEASL